ncbi:hypothetical protein FLK61_26565 [Paenalkalicoccus suaedae]|uniref:Nucleotidyltransferase domain-containing protein n=1 Tax=Paenalkalicoccus suaedae TaxID=2592382 RepID=A0A859FC21_9BACI|nr:hypothetical protein [Paenalkalicoccus suaedae]QKS70322.1 hypothetical protein FLK61_26565 [Paenalkalicoccus suaedae]
MNSYDLRKRDAELPKHRAELMRAIEADLCHDKHVLGVFYGGSIGADNEDLYSDIDLRIVVEDHQFEDYRTNKKERAHRWGSVLFFEDFPYAPYTIAHFDSFIKVDSFYYKKEDLTPSIWLQEIKIAHDPHDFLQKLQKRSQAITYEPSKVDVEIWRTKFVSYAHELYRRVRRGEFYYALQIIDSMRYSVVLGWLMEAGIRPNSFGDWARLEGERSPLTTEQQRLLVTWHCDRDPERLLSTGRAMYPEFLRLHENLVEKLRFADHMEQMEELLDMGIPSQCAPKNRAKE